MNRLFNLLYWSTFGTKGTQCCAAGRKRAQGMPFQDVSGRCPVPRNGHHDWPQSPLTQQPQHSEERKQHSDKAWRNTFSTVQGGKVISDQRTDGFRHHLHFPCSWKRLWVTISYCDCICGVVWLFFQGREGERQGSCTKAGNIEEERKMAGSGVTDIRTVPCRTFPSILAILSVVTPGREMHKLAFPFSSNLFGIQHTYLSKCCVCHAVLR